MTLNPPIRYSRAEKSAVDIANIYLGLPCIPRADNQVSTLLYLKPLFLLMVALAPVSQSVRSRTQSCQGDSCESGKMPCDEVIRTAELFLPSTTVLCLKAPSQGIPTQTCLQDFFSSICQCRNPSLSCVDSAVSSSASPRPFI